MTWAVLQQVGGQAINYVVFFALAILLGPEEFGTVGIASAWISILGAFAEVGFGAALVQRMEVRSEHLSTTFAINLVTGVVLSAIGVVCAWLLARMYSEPAVGPVMAALSASFVIRAVSLTQAAYAQRNLRFRALAEREIGASILGGAAGLVAAVSGWGVWSLVAMTLVNSTTGAALMWRTTDWRPHWREVSVTCAKDLWPFSSRIFVFSVLKAVVQNFDRVVIGYLLGAQALGVYTFAWRLVVFPTRLGSSALGAYFFPTAARLQRDLGAVRDLYESTSALLLDLVAPAMVAVALLAPLVVTDVFGQAWGSAVVLMQLLTVTAVAGAFWPLSGDLVKAMNRPGWMIGWSAAYTVGTAAALWVGAYRGLGTMVAALAGVHLLLLPVVLYMVDRVIHLRWGAIARRWLATLLASAVLGAIMWATIRFSQLSPLGRAAAALTLGTAGYALTLTAITPRHLRRFYARAQVAQDVVSVDRIR